MFKKSLLTVLFAAAVSQAAVQELIPRLTSSDLDIQSKARLELLAACSRASSPEATEADRKAICLEICEILNENPPVITVLQPLLNNLERISGEESVSTLEKLMDHKDEHVRDDARRALAVNTSPQAGQVLGLRLKARKARSPKETAGLIMALGERKEAGASNLIAPYVSNKDMSIFLATVVALGQLDEDAGIRALAMQRAKESGFRKTQLDAALFATDRKEVYARLNSDSEADQVQAVALLGLILSGETGVASPAMASGDPAQQVAVIEAALQGKNEAVCNAVASNLGSLPAYIQLQALGALEFSGNRAYAKAVQPLLHSEDLFVQDAASRVLARIGTTESVSVLLENGRPAALQALGQLNVDGVDTALEKMAAKSRDEKTRAEAIEVLANRGRTDLIPVFFQYAEEDNRTVSAAAVKAISELGTLANLDALTQLMIAKETAPVSRNALSAIVEITRRSPEQGEAVEILVAPLAGVSPRSQANILQALAQTGSDEALKPLADACTSSDEQLQKSAIKMLSGWKDKNALPIMIELAGNDSLSVANHVTLMRGVSRLLASQRRLDREQAQQALEVCRRSEERQMIQDIIDQKK
ncbi:HEAT repeat domain-containing protein [Pontiellaceae bacterium B12219]|nr:HEAT repeat domain-containing protein [Pontiellaceae bacterium B12219]